MSRPEHSPGTDSGPGPGPDAASGAVPDGRLTGLLRWYPRAWRARYGDEFLAMVEDTLDGRRPGWRLHFGVAWAGLREWGRLLSRPARRRALSQLSMCVMTGCVVAGSIGESTHPSATGTWPAVAALAALTALAAVTGAAIMAAITIAWPPLIMFLRTGSRPKVRRRLAGAVTATVAAGGMLTWLFLLQTSMTPGQLSTSQAYGTVFSVLAVLIVAAIGLWAAATRAVATHLDLEPRIRAAETLLGAVISTGVLTMVPVQIIWFGLIRSSAFWLTTGLTLLVASVLTAPRTLRQARRRARRQRRPAAVRG